MNTQFDVIVLGTGLIESIVAAGLSKTGLKVVHIDRQPYYGGTEASLTANELHEWVTRLDSRPSSSTSFSSASTLGELPSASRSYSLSLAPSIIVSTGPLISSLIGSGVSRYGGFKLLDHLLIYHDASFKPVPGSKEDIFKSKDISLVDKRKLMRFLVFASGDFENAPELHGKEDMQFLSFLQDVFGLNNELSAAIAFALALCPSTAESTSTALKRIKTHLRSTGRYGPSPFLVGHYGGLGELAQGYCRICAVSGGTYILGRELSSISRADDERLGPIYRLSLEGLGESMEGKLVIASPEYISALKQLDTSASKTIPSEDRTAYCIAVINGPLLAPTSPTELPEASTTPSDNGVSARPLDSALLVFPPQSLASGKCTGTVNVLVNGEGTLSCPRDRCILYLSAISAGSESPEELLQPYLKSTLSLLRTFAGDPPSIQYSAFYKKSVPGSVGDNEQSEFWKRKNIILCRSLPSHPSLNGDAAATDAERIFHSAMQLLGQSDRESSDSMWPPLPLDQDDED